MGILLIREMNLTHMHVRVHTHKLVTHDVLNGFHCTNPTHIIILNSMTTEYKTQTTLHDAPPH